MFTTGLRPSHILQLTNTRERLLVMGGAGTGKTYDFFTIARLAALTGSDAMFYVIDTDESSGRVLIDPAFDALWNDDKTGLKNIRIFPVSGWVELMATMQEIQGYMDQGKFTSPGLMRPQDWLMIDFLSPSYTWVQDWYARQVFGKGTDAYFLEKRKAMSGGDKKLETFEGWKDWSVINPQYQLLQDRILRAPGNLYCTAEIKPISAKDADKETKLQFGPHGVVPAGQKRNPHLFSTIIWKTSTVPGVREAITIKDRSRPEMHGQVIADFASDYLVGVAGWEWEEPKPALDPAEVLKQAAARKALLSKAGAGGQ